MVFNSVWSLLVVAYVGITPIYMTGLFHKLAALALNVLTTIFWFAGAIALSAWWGARDCNGNGWCQTVEAACAFGFFLWYVILAESCTHARKLADVVPGPSSRFSPSSMPSNRCAAAVTTLVDLRPPPATPARKCT